MTDNPDWVGSQSIGGNARLVASGNYTPGVSPPVVLSLQPTDRALLIVLGAGAYVGAKPVVTGVTSGINWAAGIGVGTAGGGFFGTTDSPLVIPVYGVIDPVVDVTFTEEVAGDAIPFWIMAGSDEVAPATNLSLQATPSDATGEQGNTLVVNNSSAQLVPAPPAGKLNVVDAVTALGNGAACDISLLKGSAAGQVLAEVLWPTPAPSTPVVPNPLFMATSLWVNNNVATALQVSAAWHTVSNPV